MSEINIQAYTETLNNYIDNNVVVPGSTLSEQERALMQFRREVNKGKVLTETGKVTWIEGTSNDPAAINARVEADVRQSVNPKQMMIFGGIMVGILLILFILFSVVRGLSNSGDDGGELEGTGVAITPTLVTPTPISADALSLVTADGRKIQAQQWRTMDIGSKTFVVQIGQVSDSGQLVFPPRGCEVSEEDPFVNTIATWIDGTIVNHAMGLPDNDVRNLGVGQRIQLRSISGFSASYEIKELYQADPNQSEIFLQTRPGITIFALPSCTEKIPVAWAAYDPGSEDIGEPTSHLPEDVVSLDRDSSFVSSKMSLSQAIDGSYSATVDLAWITSSGGMALVNLIIDDQAYAPSSGAEIVATSTTRLNWQLPSTVFLDRGSQEVTLVVQSLSGEQASVDLGQYSVSDFIVSITDVEENVDTQEIVVSISVTNDTPIDRVLSDGINATGRRGAVISGESNVQLPFIIPAGETLMLEYTYKPSGAENTTVTVFGTVIEVEATE